ncbi:juvenile hormone acid O-methyltransferase [Trichonephila clavipes]|nr:juvenile hormone acid O-methyltransferase [Trichonephila clavipes]
MKPWTLHARLELYKGIEAQSWSGVFLRGTVWDLWCVYQPPSMKFERQLYTSHKSRLVTGWLDEHFSDFSVINWPPRGPDLNPIEHLWDVLEQGVKGRQTVSTKLTELWTASINIWQIIPVERFQKLVEPIPRCVAAVIKTKGGPTRY